MIAGSGNRPVAVTVDAYSSANFLPPAFARQGVDVVHVQTTPEFMPRMAPPRLADYRDNIVLEDDDTAIARLAAYDPICVIAGQEYGVPVADRLSERMGLPTNGTALSTARRDKYEMIEVVRSAGLRCARQIRGNDPVAIRHWIEAEGVLPCVVKPLQSASTDGVTICTTIDQVGPAIAVVLAENDIFGNRNLEVVVQSFLDGPEYIVDTVSCRGRHAIAGVWAYEKRLLGSGKRIYDKDVLCAIAHPHAKAVVDYAQPCLDAFEIAHGPTHIEIIVTPDGPALVEIGARLNGNLHPAFHDACLGRNQADLTALAYADPNRFLSTAVGPYADPRQSAIVLHLTVEQEGEVVDIDPEAKARIESLPTVMAVQFKLGPGDRVKPTVDLLTSPVRAFLTGADEAAIRSDCAAIQGLQHRIYRLR